MSDQEDAPTNADAAPCPSRCYASIDLVVTKGEDGTYHAVGGPKEALFGGSGSSSDEAIGSWFRQNREVANFQVSFVEDGEFQCSTRYGVGRSREQLGPNELKALEQLERSKSA